ncbi:hypothetical protein PNOK_0219700 [Pyrrhoderma noxium]|uniref:DUF7702 domain-containing protein n=1 Tax=Pyrrhoderma noxium TaxID=2282107 RepID=A0A286URM5_9AGAM|nr:hypothetical protein PNOK_0219700 [Pyrrhoderma noxium]
MSSLDQRGDISIAILVIYPFIFFFSIILVIRHGFSKKMGWLYLSIFSLCKIVGAALHIAAEEVTPVNKSLYTGALIMEGIGLTPLLLCTFAFVSNIGADVIVKATSSNEDDRNSSGSFRKAGGILMTVGFAMIAIIHLFLWQASHALLHSQKHLLMGISCALPFLAIRVLYGLLGSFSSISLSYAVTGSSSSSLSKFNYISGSWTIYLIMSTIMEFIVITIYIFFGFRMSKVGDAEQKEVFDQQYRQVDTEMDPIYGRRS